MSARVDRCSYERYLLLKGLMLLINDVTCHLENSLRRNLSMKFQFEILFIYNVNNY